MKLKVRAIPMNIKEATFLKVLSNRFHRGPIDSIIKKLPKEDADIYFNAVTTSNDIAAAFPPANEKVEKIHYSWFAPLIATEAADQQNLLIAAMPSGHATGIRRLLRKNPQMIEIAPPLKSFLQDKLVTKLEGEIVLPLSYLPQTDLSALAELSKPQLLELIDYLGIYDLTEEIRRLVNKNHLRIIYSALLPKMHRFLRQCMHQKEKIRTPRLHLENWHGNRKDLLKLLHPRGLARLGLALNGQHPDLIWHIAHRLDIGRGNLIVKYTSKEEKPGVIFALVAQVTSAFNFLQKSES